MMKNYSKDELEKLSNNELEKELAEHEWLHRDLLQEYDERCHDGRIKFSGPLLRPEELEEYFRKCREEKMRKAS